LLLFVVLVMSSAAVDCCRTASLNAKEQLVKPRDSNRLYCPKRLRPANPNPKPARRPPFGGLGLAAMVQFFTSIRAIFETAPEKFLWISLPKNRRHGSMMA
jgi:hypothetical protein